MLAGELDDVAAALGSVATRPRWARGDDEVVAALESAFVLEQRLAAFRLTLVAEFDERRLARERGATSTTAWLRWRLRASAGAAGRMVSLARAVAARPATAGALASGDITVEQAHAITDAVAGLPTDTVTRPPDAAVQAVMVGGERLELTPQIVDQVEAVLVEHAAVLDPQALRTAGRHALHTIAPDLAQELERRALDDAERRANQRRRLDFRDDQFGGAELCGYLDPEGAAIVRTALGPLTKPRGATDDRQAGQRRADALIDVCHKVMRDGVLPTQGSRPTQLVVTTNYESLLRDLDGSASNGLTDGDLGVGRLGDGQLVSPSTVRRMACDAMVLPAILNTDGAVLDLGRDRRLFGGAVRRALDLRDGGCAFPGCDRPADWCEAHHMLSWLLGGATDVDNGVLVCRVHHRLLHEPDGWQVRLGRDRLPEFIPPAWIDPERIPQRNIRQRTRSP